MMNRLLTAVLVLCAMAVTGVTLRREFTTAGSAATGERERIVSNWQEHVDYERLEGGRGAPVVLIEYGDFQCPFCKDMAATISKAMARYGQSVSVLYKHYPLEAIHRYALPAAVASECARTQGVFRAYHDTLFGAQDVLGTRSWNDMAAAVAIPDSTAFAACMSDSASFALVRSDAASARALKLRGTPALLINNRLVEGALTDDELDAYIQAALKDRDKE